MSARERILMIRLLDKAEKHPDCARTFGIEGSLVPRSQVQDAWFPQSEMSRRT